MPGRTFDTALGPCTVAWEGREVTGFRLLGGDEASVPEGDVPAWVQPLIARVRQHLAGAPEDYTDLPFAFSRVSAFQGEVYRGALQVKAGQTLTYGGLARAIGQPVAAARAVGTALGQNPWPLLVPCHRFVGADGTLTGFSAPGGIKTKLRLLALEGAQLFAE
jgi:methylated-DNA-[protein]-cysteine S-methyltransferase